MEQNYIIYVLDIYIYIHNHTTNKLNNFYDIITLLKILYFIEFDENKVTIMTA